MKVFICCGASDEVDKKYGIMASSVSTSLARMGYKLLYGGADTGMMGKCYMTFKYEGQKVKAITDLKYAHMLENLEVDASEVKKNTFDRTSALYQEADVVLILPGGIGTLAELFSILEETRTRNNDKQIVLYNFDNYYLGVLSILREMHEKKFIKKEVIKLINVINEEKTLIKYFDELRKKEL